MEERAPERNDELANQTVEMNLAMCAYHEMQYGRPDPECDACEQAQADYGEPEVSEI